MDGLPDSFYRLIRYHFRTYVTLFIAMDHTVKVKYHCPFHVFPPLIPHQIFSTHYILAPLIQSYSLEEMTPPFASSISLKHHIFYKLSTHITCILTCIEGNNPFIQNFFILSRQDGIILPASSI